MIIMKNVNVRRNIRVLAFMLILGVMTVSSIFAQPNTNSNNNNARSGDNTTRVVEREDDTDWGWLGLLGLLGLAGLIPKKRKVEVQEFRDTGSNQPTSGTKNTH
jgi:MYXO-CTERM domain-containing protein